MCESLGVQEYDLEATLEDLVEEHEDKNIPGEPYCGVGALFNGDLQREIQFADRQEWIVDSSTVFCTLK